MADLAVQLDNLLHLGDCPAELALGTVDHRHVIASHRLPGPVIYLPSDRQRLPEVLCCCNAHPSGLGSLITQ